MNKNITRAFRANLHISLAIGLFALAVILSYYYIPIINSFFTQIASLKDSAGLRFAMISTAVFGGLLPLLLEQLRRLPVRELNAKTLFFFLVFWMLKGVEIDLLYAGQAYIFGETPKPTTVLAKTAVDQFIYLPLWGAPTMVLAYLWLDKNFDWRRTLSSVDAGWYKKLVLPVMAVNWIIWIPAVTIIYSLPLPLQLPMQNIVLLMFAVILIFVTSQNTDQRS